MNGSNKINNLPFNVPSIVTTNINPGGIYAINSKLTTKVYNAGLIVTKGEMDYLSVSKKIKKNINADKGEIEKNAGILFEKKLVKDDLFLIEKEIEIERAEAGIFMNTGNTEASYICFSYSPQFTSTNELGKGANLIREVRQGNKKFTHMSFKDHPAVYEYHLIKTEKIIDFPKDHVLCLYRGNVLINGKDRTSIAWIKSTKNQEINIVNKDQNSDCLIVLLKTIQD